MKRTHTVGLIAGMLIASSIAGAQVLTNIVGIPLGSPLNFPPGSSFILGAVGIEHTDLLLSESYTGGFYSQAFAGDLGFYPEGGSSAPSNWLADMRFFNPSDPTGSQGLAATEVKTFFPEDVGPNGFAGLTLFPHYNLVPVPSSQVSPLFVVGVDNVFGPVGIIPSGVLGSFVYTVARASAATVPEPGGLPLLVGAGVSGVSLFTLRRLRRRKH